MPDIDQQALEKAVIAALQSALASGVIRVAELPRLYKFPEDIYAILGGHVPESTIRSWKHAGYLRTRKIGIRTFVTQESWQWFLDNHKELMAKEGRRHPRKEAAAKSCGEKCQ